MIILVERRWPKGDYTIGRVYLNGVFVGNSLEPPIGNAAEAETSGSKKAIKAGSYLVKMEYSPRFRKKLPRLQNVPGRVGILIHAGNTVRNTSGCILVGQNTEVGKVMNSQTVLREIVTQVEQAEARGEPVVITMR